MCIRDSFASRTTTLPRGGGPDGRAPIMIAKGTMVTYSAFSLHRNEAIYGPDACEFRPERWESLKGLVWEFVPFNRGESVLSVR